jgi:hypothetical protein
MKAVKAALCGFFAISRSNESGVSLADWYNARTTMVPRFTKDSLNSQA